jgi:hypothetical protein
MPVSVVMAISGKAPNSSHRAIRACRNKDNVGSHRPSSLQLPQRMALPSSIRQLHSTPSVTSPSGLPGAPSFLGREDSSNLDEYCGAVAAPDMADRKPDQRRGERVECVVWGHYCDFSAAQQGLPTHVDTQLSGYSEWWPWADPIAWSVVRPRRIDLMRSCAEVSPDA